LGAFLLGVVVASTPQKLEMERVFEGLRDMFGAVFFVAMGMLVDFRLLLSAWPLVLGVTLFALFCRSLATSTGLVLAGHETRESVRAGLALTPLGEFSFIAAQMGVTAGVLPAHFFPVAVGASLLTSLTAPVVIRRSDRISGWVDKHLPLMLREWIAFYHGWLELMVRRRQRSVLWKLTSKRLVQVAVEMIVVSGLMIFARPAFEWIQSELGDKWLFVRGTSALFWTVFVIVLLLPLVALWRNIGALSMIAAEWVTLESPRRETLQPLLERALRGVSSVMLVIWLVSLMPFGGPAGIVLILVFMVIMLRAGLVWRRLIFWQSKLEIELRTQLQAAVGGTEKKDLKQLLDTQQDQWELQAGEYTLPDFSSSTGQRIGELALRTRFGCSIASIDRQGLVIVNPAADVVLYPNDKLLLLGNQEQVAAAISYLGEARTEDAAHEIEEFSLGTMQVPAGSPLAGKPLAELDLFRRAGVQIAGIQRGSKRVLTPGGAERIEAGDVLLVLGTPRRVAEFESMLGSEKETRSKQEPAAA
jgi:CPA2 family monovalent cation:H+ antiporter-2